LILSPADDDLSREVLKRVSQSLDDEEAKDLGRRLGISLIEMTKFEMQLKDSSQDPLCLLILSHFNASTQKNKLVAMATCLVQMGREDCLAQLIGGAL
jgi:hypothetical protein